MAAPTVLTNATIWYGGYDLTGATNEITMNAARAEKPVSRFGDTVEATYPGAMTVGVEANGFWDSALDGPQFTQLTAPTTSWPLTVCPDGGDESETAYGLDGYSFNYSTMEAAFGQSVPYRLSIKAKSGTSLARGAVMLPKATILDTTLGTKIQVGAVSSSQKLVAHFHLFALTGVSSWTLYAMSDADSSGGGETIRATQASVTSAPSSYTLEASGPITDTWWQARAIKSSGTNLTIAATFAIVDA